MINVNQIFNPKRLRFRQLFITAIGTFAGIGALTFLTVQQNLPLLIASFGASAVLLYGVPDAPMAKTRSVLGGHCNSALVGITCFQLLSDTWFSMTLAVTLAIIVMLLTDTVHPPGGATALVCVMQQADYTFMFTPVLLGAFALVLIGKTANILRI